MTDRFARANLFCAKDDNCLVTIRVGNGDYYELTAISRYHAEQKLHEFADANRLILTETAGFDRAVKHVEQSKETFHCVRPRRSSRR